MIRYSALKLVPSAILRRHGELTRAIVFLTEGTIGPHLDDELRAHSGKWLSFHFSRDVLNDNADAIRGGFARLLSEIEEETERIELDRFARGSIVDVGEVVARYTEDDREGEWYWSIAAPGLRCPMQADDPPEYWGDFHSDTDFVAAAGFYPWMQVQVSGSLPF